MARREFAQYEAVSAVVPGEGGYSAAIAVKVWAPVVHHASTKCCQARPSRPLTKLTSPRVAN